MRKRLISKRLRDLFGLEMKIHVRKDSKDTTIVLKIKNSKLPKTFSKMILQDATTIDKKKKIRHIEFKFAEYEEILETSLKDAMKWK